MVVPACGEHQWSCSILAREEARLLKEVRRGQGCERLTEIPANLKSHGSSSTMPSRKNFGGNSDEIALRSELNMGPASAETN